MEPGLARPFLTPSARKGWQPPQVMVVHALAPSTAQPTKTSPGPAALKTGRLTSEPFPVREARIAAEAPAGEEKDRAPTLKRASVEHQRAGITPPGAP